MLEELLYIKMSNESANLLYATYVMFDRRFGA